MLLAALPLAVAAGTARQVLATEPAAAAPAPRPRVPASGGLPLPPGDPRLAFALAEQEGSDGRFSKALLARKRMPARGRPVRASPPPAPAPTLQEDAASNFGFLRLPRPPAAALAALNGRAPEDAAAAAYAREVCANFSWPLRDLSEGRAPDLYWGIMHDRERELVQMALYEMRGLVKAMVIVESNVTQTGAPRRLLGAGYYAELAKEVPGAPRVVHRAYGEPLKCKGPLGKLCHAAKYGTELGRERTIRNWMLGGWKKAGARPHDIVMVADADEFAHSRFLYALRRCAWNDPRGRRPGENRDCSANPIVGARIAFFHSYFNCPSRQWYWHPNAITFKCMLNGSEPQFGRNKSPADARWTADDVRSAYTRPVTQVMQLPPFMVGWHLRNFFSPEEEQRKYLVYGHPRYEPLQQILRKRAESCVNDPGSLHHAAPASKRPRVLPIRTEYLPLLVQKRRKRFARFFYRPELIAAALNASTADSRSRPSLPPV
eukprot:TRINITY_DN25919_c0_g1_i1.p1 TRINITY_DN25919_c0_g1~~TRINITY_DN25919_c0_g1_i1.p1  ORF type:complete len:522 (+),score=101.84 TRINITY_DN25919_c0_g1_i1:97-1566(+)